MQHTNFVYETDSCPFVVIRVARYMHQKHTILWYEININLLGGIITFWSGLHEALYIARSHLKQIITTLNMNNVYLIGAESMIDLISYDI